MFGTLRILSGKLWENRMELDRNGSQPCATHTVRFLVSGKDFKMKFFLLMSPLRIVDIEDINFRAYP